MRFVRGMSLNGTTTPRGTVLLAVGGTAVDLEPFDDALIEAAFPSFCLLVLAAPLFAVPPLLAAVFALATDGIADAPLAPSVVLSLLELVPIVCYR